jgi:hypothetical protein
MNICNVYTPILIRCFGFFKYIIFTMYLDIVYIQHQKLHLEKTKCLIFGMEVISLKKRFLFWGEKYLLRF